MSRVPARVRALRWTSVPRAAERWRGAGPARRADLRAPGLSVPSPAIPGLVPGRPAPLPAHSCARPRKPLETPGAWSGVPTPAKLTSRGQALPARATTPRPGGAGQSPAQDTPPAAAASAGVELPQARLRLARACVTEGSSPTLGAPAGRRPRPQRPANAQSRLPQTNTQWILACLWKATSVKGRAARVFITERQSRNVRPRPAPGVGPPHVTPPAAQPL